MNSARWAPLPAHLLPLAALVFGLGAILSMLLGPARPAYAQGPADPAQAVRADLAARGYQVLEVGLVADEPGHPGVVMKIASQQLDARVTAQLQDGWTALATYYREPIALYNYLEYRNRYWLVWVIGADDWNDWLAGDLPSEEFWDHVEFAVWDKVRSEAVESRGFVDKNFGGKGPPGPDPVVDPANAADANAAVLLDAESAFVPLAEGSPAGTTLLARASDPAGNRLPRQPVTITVASGVGKVTPGVAVGDESGTARAAYSTEIRAVNPVSGTGGVPVEVIAYGAGGPDSASRVMLLVSSPAGANVELAKQRTVQAMQLQDYQVLDFYYEEYPYPVGNVTFIYAGPVLEAASAELDAALFHQIKLALGTARTAFQGITNPVAMIRFPYRGAVYMIQVAISSTDWDAWVGGSIAEADFWRRAQFYLYDEQWNPVGNIDHSCKDFGAGCDEPRRSELPNSAGAAVSEQEWGVQHSYGKIYVPAGSSAGRFEPQTEGDVREWRIYQAPNFTGAPVYSSADDEDGSRLRELELGPGHYVVAAYTDNPPATLTLNYVEFVSY